MTTPEPYTFDPAAFGGDPTPEEVTAIAKHLACRFPADAPIPEGIPARLTAEIIAALGRLAGDPALYAGTSLSAEGDARAVVELLDGLRSADYHKPLGDLANNLLPWGALLFRTARQAAAAAGSCRLGGPGPCDGPERVQLTAHSAFGKDAEMIGCPRHIASEALKWDHRGEVELTLAGDKDPVMRVQARLSGAWTHGLVPTWTGSIEAAG